MTSEELLKLGKETNEVDFAKSSKLKDNEIIKALECCSQDDIDCEECPANGLCDNDDYCFTGAILDLIKRKDEMINGLIAGQETLQKGLSEKQVQIEKLEKIEHFATKTIETQTTEIEFLEAAKNLNQAKFNEVKAELEWKKAEVEKLQDSNRRLRDDMKMMLNNDNGSDLIRIAAYKEVVENAYKLLCNKENWNILKESRLENGECFWLKELFDNMIRNLEDQLKR